MSSPPRSGDGTGLPNAPAGPVCFSPLQQAPGTPSRASPHLKAPVPPACAPNRRQRGNGDEGLLRFRVHP
jgi:hypothetical protein